MVNLMLLKQYSSDLEMLQKQYGRVEIFGSTLSDVLEQNELRQIDLSLAIPVDESTVSKWISGTQLPSLEMLDSIVAKSKLDFQDEIFLRHAYNWDRWMRHSSYLIDNLKKRIESNTREMTDNELREVYLRGLKVIRAIISLYESRDIKASLMVAESA